MSAIDCIEILSPGLQTTVQDLGRFGFGRFGVAASGAMDSFALRVANLLVANSQDQACLETTLLGLRFRALTDVLIAVTGADLQPVIGQKPIPMWHSLKMSKGEIFSCQGPLGGCRAYIAFGGKIQIPAVMGSRSTNLPSAFGGYQGRTLQSGDILAADLPADKLKALGRSIDPRWVPIYSNTWSLRVMWGPQDDDFTETGRGTFLDSSYQVSPDSDRTGIRLQGPKIQRKRDVAESIISEGVISGAIQIPGDGKPIIILGETVSGGYRKIATVIAADLPLLGQIKPGDEIHFRVVTSDEALQALVEVEEKLRRIEDSFSNT